MPNKVALVGLLTPIITLSAPAPASAQGAVAAQDLIPDARSHGMGGAFTAVAEGPSAIWWNPGALGLEQPISFSPYSESQLAPDFAGDIWVHTFGAIGHWPRGDIGFGAHLTHLSYGRQVLTDFSGNVIGEIEPTENVLLVGAGTSLLGGRQEKDDRLRLGVGTNFRFFDVSEFWLLPPDFVETVEGSSWDIDVGALLAYRLPLGAGLEKQPVRSPHVDLRGGLAVVNLFGRHIHYSEDASDPLVRRLRVGGAVELNLPPVSPLDRFDSPAEDDRCGRPPFLSR